MAKTCQIIQENPLSMAWKTTVNEGKGHSCKTTSSIKTIHLQMSHTHPERNTTSHRQFLLEGIKKTRIDSRIMCLSIEEGGMALVNIKKLIHSHETKLDTPSF